MVTKKDWGEFDKEYQRRKNIYETRQNIRFAMSKPSEEQDVFKPYPQNQWGNDEYQSTDEDAIKNAEYFMVKADKEMGKDNYWDAKRHLIEAYDEARLISSSDKNRRVLDAVERRLLRLGKKALKSKSMRLDEVDVLINPMRREMKQERSGLESKAGVALASLGFLASLFFFSFNLTGDVISNISAKDGNILGMVLFLAGLAGLFVHFRKR